MNYKFNVRKPNPTINQPQINQPQISINNIDILRRHPKEKGKTFCSYFLGTSTH